MTRGDQPTSPPYRDPACILSRVIFIRSCNLVPASAAVPAASAQHKQYKHDDKKCGEIHGWPPKLLSDRARVWSGRTTFLCNQLFHFGHLKADPARA
ncbi:hypothetical protein J2X72_003507 [Phyllobacterium sp. 1468]|nr:hypothetical protein [Phyllobacterium sp. 1468]